MKNEDDIFSLCFVYELNTLPGQPKQWVELRNWEIESLEGESKHFVLDLKLKNDHANILSLYMKHTFLSLYVCINSSPEAKPFNMDTHLANYKLSATSRHLGDSMPFL